MFHENVLLFVIHVQFSLSIQWDTSQLNEKQVLNVDIQDEHAFSL